MFLKDLSERVVASFAGGFLSVTGMDAVNVLEMDWKAALGVGAGAAVISLLKGAAAKFRGNRASASLTKDI